MTRVVIVIGFLLSFAAGLVIGLSNAGTDTTQSGTDRPQGRSGWLAAQLDLTPGQHEAMNEIWSETASRPYVYSPAGILLPERGERVILYDAVSCHPGLR